MLLSPQAVLCKLYWAAGLRNSSLKHMTKGRLWTRFLVSVNLMPCLPLSLNRLGVGAEEVLGMSVEEGLARECPALLEEL